MGLDRLLPKTIYGWEAAAKDNLFDRRTIFDYMNGAGEIYLAYDFRILLVREYTGKSSPPIAAEIYQMSSSEDAYGVFSQDPDGEEVEVGQGALYGMGLLRFWKGKIFVRILAEKETAESKSAVMALGKKIAEAIPAKGGKPALLDWIPSEGLRTNLIPLDKCTALINVPSIKVHAHTGIAVAIKNYINFGSNLSQYHSEGSSRLGEIWLKPEVKGKTRLVIVDALRPYFGPGPQINPLHRWDYKGILAGTDPVSLDTTCLRICQVKRNLFRKEEWLITPPPKSIDAADTKYRLGTSDPVKIKLVRLGWDRDTLI